MGFRFRKSIRLIPGVRLNISKTGISTSIGPRGATINVGKRGVRGTVGLPGSGLSYSDMILRSQNRGSRPIGSDPAQPSARKLPSGLFIAVAIAVIFGVVLFGAGLMSARQSTPLPVSNAVSPPLQSNAGPQAGLQADSESARITTEANCRANPSSRAKVVTVIGAREAVTIVSTQAGWSRVTTGDTDCWVSSRYVK